MDKDAWKILLVDDDEDYFLIIQDLLSENRPGVFRLDWAGTYEDAWNRMQGGDYDCVLMDYALGTHPVGSENGLDLTRKAADGGHQFPPIILLTGLGSYAVDLEAMQAGAAFYLTKDEINSRVLERSIRYAIERRRIEEKLVESEAELRASEKRYRELVRFTPVAICEVDFRQKQFTWVNEAMCELLGYSRAELVGMDLYGILDDEGKIRATERINRWLGGEEPETTIEYQFRAKDGRTVHVVLNIALTKDAKGRPLGATGIVFDITERRRAEQELKYQHELLDTVIRNIPVAITLMRGSDLRIEVVNPAYQVLTSGEEMVGKTLDELCRAKDPKFLDLCRQVLSVGEPYHVIDDSRMIRRSSDGPLEPAFFSWSLYRVDLPSEKGWGILNVAWETTERKRAEEALQQSQKEIRRLIDTSFEGIWSVDRNGKTTFVNQRAAEILGYSVDEILQVDAFQFLMPGEVSAGQQTLAKIAAGESGRVEAYARSKDGSEAVLLVSYSPIMDECGEFQGALAMFGDITERMRAEQAACLASEQLKEYSEKLEEMVRDRTEELVNMQRRLVDNMEAERLWVSQELHDGPMQEIYGLIFKLSAIHLADAAMQTEIASVVDKLHKVNDDLRSVARELRPTTLVPFGLEKAIREYSERFDQEHPELDVILDLMPDGNRLQEHVRLSLFRIYQVAMTNVIRHAQAKTIYVRLTLDEESVVLDIQDDGKGFEVPMRLRTFARQGHYGLAGAMERAESMGGRVMVESALGKGTRFRVIVPVVTPVPSQA